MPSRASGLIPSVNSTSDREKQQRGQNMRITNRKTKGLGEPQPGKKKQKHRSSRYLIGTFRLPPVLMIAAVIGGCHCNGNRNIWVSL